MLRLFVLLLVLLNSVYFAWSEGLLLGLGYGPVQQTEPERLAQQIKPEVLRLLTTQEQHQLEQASRPVPKPTECLQAGLFDEAQSALLHEALVAAEWPAAAWTLAPTVVPGRWIVYLGKYSKPETLAKKRSELLALDLKPLTPTNTELQPGWSLGGFDTEAAATAELQALVHRGVRSARVVQERPEVQGKLLRLPAVDEALRTKLADIKPLLANEPLRACR